MSTSNAKTPAELFDEFIKLEWHDIFRTEIHLRLKNGARYVPNSGSHGVQLLRKNVNAFDEAIRIWSGSTDDPDSGTEGYDRIVEQAGVEYTWEWFLIDPARPWASSVPELVRERITADLDRRSQDAVTNVNARAAEAERLTEEEDEAMIAAMNAKRLAQGKEALSEQQEASVWEQRQSRREKPS